MGARIDTGQAGAFQVDASSSQLAASGRSTTVQVLPGVNKYFCSNIGMQTATMNPIGYSVQYQVSELRHALMRSYSYS
jgi:hypothetical protein